MPVGQQSLALSEGTAKYVLDRFVADRRVTSADVRRYLGEMQSEIRQIEERIARLRAIAADPESPGRQTPLPPQRARRTKRRPARGNGKALGGMYGGLIRRLPRDQQQQYKDIKAADGIEAAIAALRRRRAG
jgi:hypothetical protein